MLGHLTLQCPFQHRLGELLQKTVDILGRPPLFQHLIDLLIADRRLLLLSLHFRPPSFTGERLHSS